MKFHYQQPSWDLGTALVLAALAIGVMTAMTYLQHPYWFVPLVGATTIAAIFLSSTLKKVK